jgi:class 3 adenylate cyclase
VGFLFTDIEGSTQQWEEQPQPMAAALRHHDRLVRRASETNHGYIFATGGDGFGISFSTVDEAIATALEVQRALGRDKDEFEVSLAVRMGIHAGSSEERDGDYFGPVLNRAARLLDAAHGGQILITAVAAGLLTKAMAPQVELHDLGVHRLRDLVTPEHILQVVVSDLRRDFPPPRTRRVGNIPRSHVVAVGREQEVTETIDALSTSRLVTVVAPADRSSASICLGAARSVDALFPHGTWWVDLSRVSRADEVAPTVAEALGVAGQPPSDEDAGATALAALEEGLGGDRALLVLLGCTTCEALSKGVSGLLEQLPTVSVLTASPDPLRQPGEQTIAVGERVLPPDLQRLRTNPLLGRDRELGLLREEASRAIGGQRRLVMVSGEEGMGKSRLVAELAAELVADDGLVLRGAWREERVTDFQAFREAVSRHFDDVEPAVLRARFGDLLPALDALVPHDPAEVTTGDVDRFALLDALDTWLARLASAQPVLLWLDDLQWADPSSLQMLLHLARSPRPAPIVIATTYQPGALARDDDVSRTLAQLRRAPGFARIELIGLPATAARELVAGTVHAPVGPRSQTRLHRWSGGNPFFLQELARLLDESTTGSADHHRSVVDLEELGVPESVVEVVRWRLANRSPRLAEALSVAAVIGTTFDATTLAAVLETEQEEVDELLDEACLAGFVEVISDRPSELAFRQDLVRQALYQDLPPRQRHRLHRRVLRVLLEEPEPDPGVVARHLGIAAEAVDLDRMVEFATRAARRATEQLAYENAARQYDAALRVLDRYPEVDAPRVELLVAAGEAYNRAGALIDGRERLKRAAAEAMVGGQDDLLARAGLAWGGVLPVAPPVDAEAVELLRSIGDRFPGDTPERARALAREAEWLQREMPYEERRALIDEAVAVAGRLEDPAVLGWVLNSSMLALHGPDEAAAMPGVAEQVIALSRRAQDDELAFEGWKLLLHGLFATGSTNRTRDVAATVRRLGEHLRQPEYLRVALMWDATTATLEGRFDLARQRINETLTVTLTGEHSQVSDIQFMLRVPRFALRGTSPRVRTVVDGLGGDGMRTFRAWFHAEAGHPDEAWPLLQTPNLVEEISRRRWYMFWADVVGFGTAAALLGHTDLASGLRDLIAPYREHNAVLGVAAFMGAVAHHLGVLDGVLADWGAAVTNLELALERHRAMGARPWVALTQIELARVLRARGAPGDPALAEALTAEAVVTADALDLRAVHTRVGQPVATSPK